MTLTYSSIFTFLNAYCSLFPVILKPPVGGAGCEVPSIAACSFNYIYCYGMLTAVKWLTGVAKRPDPTRWTLAVFSHTVTTTTIQALALLLAFETMKTLRTGCWRYIYTLKYVNWTSFSDIMPLLLSYVFHSMFQSSLVNKYRHRSHARTLLHSHTGICDGSPGQRIPLDTLENMMKTSENDRFVFPGNVNGCSYFDHSVVQCSLLHSGIAQSQGHSCPRCSCSHTGWHSSAPSVPPHKLPQSTCPITPNNEFPLYHWDHVMREVKGPDLLKQLTGLFSVFLAGVFSPNCIEWTHWGQESFMCRNLMQVIAMVWLECMVT